MLTFRRGQNRTPLFAVVVAAQRGPGCLVIAEQPRQGLWPQVALGEERAQLEQHRRGRQFVPRDFVARDVGKHDLVARRKQGFKEHVEVLLAPIDVAEFTLEAAQIQFGAAGWAWESMLAQSEDEHRAEGDRAHGHEGGHAHAARQIVTAAPRQGGDGPQGELGGDAIGDWQVAEAVVGEIVERGQCLGDDGPPRVVLFVKDDVGRDKAAHEGEPFAQGPLGSGGKSCIRDKRAREQAESQAALVVAGQRRAGQIGLAAQQERGRGVLLWRVEKRSQGKSAQALFPGKEIALHIRVLEIATVRPAYDTKVAGESAPGRGRGFRKSRHQAGMREQGQEVLAAEARKGQAHQEFDGSRRGVPVCGRKIRDAVGQFAAFGEDGGNLRQVEILARLGNDDRDVAQAKRGILAHQRPDLGGHDLQFAAQGRTGQHAQAAVNGFRGGGCFARSAFHDVVLHLAQQRAAVTGFCIEARIETRVEAGAVEPREQAQILPAGSRPQPKRELRVLEKPVRIARRRVGRRGKRARVLAAGTQGVDAHLGMAGQRGQHAMVRGGDVGKPEDVQGLASKRCWFLRHGLVPQGFERLIADVSRRFRQSTFGPEDLQPKRALPDADLGFVAGASVVLAFRPGGQHVGPRTRVFVEELRQLGGKLAAPPVHGIAMGSRRDQVFANRRQNWSRQQAIVVQEREQVTFDVTDIGDARAGNGLFGDGGQKFAQEGRLDVGRNAAAFANPEAQVGFHIAVGHHHLHGRERTSPLAFVGQILDERIEEHLGAVGCADADQGAQDTTCRCRGMRYKHCPGTHVLLSLKGLRQASLTGVGLLPLQVTLTDPVLGSPVPVATCPPLASVTTYELPAPELGLDESIA